MAKESTPSVDFDRLAQAARLAGLLFFLTLLLPVLNWLLILSRFIVDGDGAATAQNILDDDALFRLGIAAYVLISLVALALGTVLYAMLRHVDKTWALAGLSLKVVESALTAMTAVVLLLALLLMTTESAASAVPSSLASAGLLLESHVPATAVTGIFHGLSFIVFLSLLHRSRLVPPALTRFGFVAYVLVVCYDTVLIVAPEVSQMPVVQAVGWGPIVLFEPTIGSWLLSKGVTPNQSQRT